MAFVTSGLRCPTFATAMPDPRSKKMLPSMSFIHTPSVSIPTKGDVRDSDGDNILLSRAINTRAFGPGGSTIIFGFEVSFNVIVNL